MEILEYCNKYDVIKKEQYYINLIKPEYNILKIAGSRLGHKHTKETREMLSTLQKGRVVSKETRAILSAFQKGRIETKETRAKKSAANPKSRSVEVTDIKTNITTVYTSIREAARDLNSSCPSLIYSMKVGNLFKKRYKIVKI